MTLFEAKEIFESWQEYVEYADKLHRIFPEVPQSFQPYPSDILMEALNIIREYYFCSGNKDMAEKIENTAITWVSKVSDNEALSSMKKMLDLIESNTDFKNAMLKSLKDVQDIWIEARKERNQIKIMANKTDSNENFDEETTEAINKIKAWTSPFYNRLTNFLIAITIGTIVLITVFVWPTQYRYENATLNDDKYLVRINRFTSSVDKLTRNGWLEMLPYHYDGPKVEAPAATPAPTPMVAPTELGKSKHNGSYEIQQKEKGYIPAVEAPEPTPAPAATTTLPEPVKSKHISEIVEMGDSVQIEEPK